VYRLAPRGDESFLLGGWSFGFNAFRYACPILLGTPPPFGPRCGTPFVSDVPLMNEAPRVMLAGRTADFPTGPVILRVHRHDERAAGCAPDARDACEAMAVIEDVVWTGDAWTESEPLSPIEALGVLITADANLTVATLRAMPQPRPPAPSSGPFERPFPHPTCRAPFPALAWSITGSRLTSVLVFPSTAAREANDQDFTASGYRGVGSDGTTCFTITDSLFAHEWVAVDNVMVAIDINVDGPTPAQAAFIHDVRTALEGP
jgi:hypothetical protein